ncbi:MAG TPA: hypothetical protein VNY05_24905 [Candidatus Acidoferrales bacterium]|nr:hypothetical protein [Candidatus Acidoferrales bacterium]
MTQKLRAWLLVLMVATLCAASLGGLNWYRSRALTVMNMLQRLPVQDALIVYIDFSELRRGGILALLDGSKVGEDADYKKFVQQTEFDYKQDLDSALLAFAPAGKYMLLSGRFEWTSLKKYVQTQGGSCINLLCRMAGSDPSRHISFLPVQSNLMALAVSSDESAALRMTEVASRQGPDIPNAPVWASLPPSIVRSGTKLPDDAQRFAKSLERAESTTIEFVVEGNHYAAKLSVRCTNEQDAAALQAELTKATAALLQNLQVNHHKPDPLELAGVLSAGTFTNQGRQVFGHWVIEQAFLQNLLAG